MEDEELLQENSDLCNYLREVGFSDFETVKRKQPNEYILDTKLVRDDKLVSLGLLEADTMEDIDTLLSAKLIFEEDVVNMQNILTNFQIVKTSLLKNMFQGTTAAVVVFLGLISYFIMGGYVFVLISSFYAYRATDYLWKKHFTQKRIKKFVTALQANFLLLKKALRFIFENNHILKDLDKTDKQFCSFFKFKQDFIESERSIVQLLSTATKKLIKMFPMVDNVENVPHYICNSCDEAFINSLDESKLHQLYTLLQSEFIQRVILTMIPSLQVSANTIGFHKTLHQVTADCMKLKTKLNKQFKFLYLYGVCHETKVNLPKVPAQCRSIKQSLTSEILVSIHDTSNRLQSLLIRARDIESKFDAGSAEEQLVYIQNDLTTCQNSISDSLIYLKKLHSLEIGGTEEMPQVVEKETPQLDDHTLVGFTDLDPVVDDEIFEAEISTEDVVDADFERFDFEDMVKKKREEEYSRCVLKELKSKIVDKAKDWERREAEIMRRKFGENYVEKDKEVCEELPSVNWPLSHVKRCLVNRKNGRIVSYESVTSDVGRDDEDFNVGRIQQNACAMRDLMMQSRRAVPEQVFTAFGENSDEELECT